MNKYQRLSILLVLNLLSLCYVFAIDCDKQLQFQCVEDTNKVNIGGVIMDCPEKYICNIDKLTSCDPCIKKSDNCNGHFECPTANPDQVNINKIPYQCPTGYTCNKDMEDPCNPCIRKKCAGAQSFICKEGDPQEVVVNNVVLRCDYNYVCNKDFKFPCTPCIDKQSAAEKFIAQLRMRHHF